MPTIILQDDSQIVIITDPANVGLSGEQVAQVGNQPTDEKSYKFATIVGFRVEHTQAMVLPTAPTISGGGP